MKKPAFLAASAILLSSFTPVAIPNLVGTAAAVPTQDELIQICQDNADTFGHGQILPADGEHGWHWEPVATPVSSSGEGDFTIEGYALNPASRTIHAIVTFDGTSEVFDIACNAVNPGDQINDHFSYFLNDFVIDEGGTPFTGRPAVCNPALTKKSGPVTTWYEIPGTEPYRDGKTCAQIAAGPLLSWSSL